MPKASVNFRSSQVGAFSFDVEHLYVRGGPDFPSLGVFADVTLCAYTQFREQAPTIHPLSLIRVAAEFCSPEHVVAARAQTDIDLLALHPQPPASTQARIEFPLDLAAVTAIERTRSGNLQAVLKIKLLFALHSPKENGGAVELFQVGNVNDIAFSIQKSQWIETLLPQLGYGGLEILEVRFGPAAIARELPKSVVEIQEAKRYLLEGDWEKAVGHCRKAIELILESRTPLAPGTVRFKEKVNAFISDNLKVGDQQAKLIAAHMGTVWEVSSQSVHPSQTVFTRADAEFIVRSTAALLEYVSRLLN
jgi:hypothetical protein